MERHPADESKLSVFLNVIVPALVAGGIFIASFVADLACGTSTWTQRSGNILIVFGAYIAYHEARRSLQVIEGSIYFNLELWYKALAIALILIGTVVTGYGDLIVRAITMR